MSANYLKRELVSHTRRVCALYKVMMRDIVFWESDFFEHRFKQLQLRQMFEAKRNIKDIRVAKKLLEEAEINFRHNMIHPHHQYGPSLQPFAKNGIAYGRELLSPDYVMDSYHPLEKAQYPFYFAKREAMKDEYIKLWKKKMMRPGEDQVPDRS